MDHVTGLKCVLCGAEYSPDEVLYVCPKHGDEGILDVIYDYDLIAQRLTRESLAANGERSIWRYKPLLPVRPDSPVPPLAVGWTPLYPARRLRERLGLADLWVKDDGRNPSASFKDRASAVGITVIRRDRIAPVRGAHVPSDVQWIACARHRSEPRATSPAPAAAGSTPSLYLPHCSIGMSCPRD